MNELEITSHQPIADPGNLGLEKRMALSVKEVCSALAVSKSTVHAWIGQGILTAAKINNRTLIPVDAVKDLLDRSLMKRGA